MIRLTEKVEVEFTLCVTLLYPRRFDVRKGGRAFRVGAVLVVCLVIATVIVILPLIPIMMVMRIVIIWNMDNGEHLVLALSL